MEPLNIHIQLLNIRLLSREDKCIVILIQHQSLLWTDNDIIRITFVIALILILTFQVIFGEVWWSSLMRSILWLLLLLRLADIKNTITIIQIVVIIIIILHVLSIQCKWNYILHTHCLKKLPKLFPLTLFRDWYTK